MGKKKSAIGLPDGMTPDEAYVQGMADAETRTVDCTPTDEGWAAAIVLLSSGVIGRVRSCEQEKVAELLDSIVEVAAYLGHKGHADLLADAREKVRRMTV